MSSCTDRVSSLKYAVIRRSAVAQRREVYFQIPSNKIIKAIRRV